jgi:hypothetical protein
VGGGKSYCSVNRALNYMASGCRVVSNIKLAGWSEFCGAFCPSSPVVEYLRDTCHWTYQPGQYIYIPFSDMAESPTWISRVPAGPDRKHRNLLIIDEATDLFDAFDREKVRGNDGARDLFRFLRLSRHVHVDVLFIAQDLSAINSRLRGLVSFIWRATNLAEFRLPFFKMKYPCATKFLLQQFDRRGTAEVDRVKVRKNPKIFACYQSEAFNGDVGISSDGVVIADGRIIETKGKKKMNMFERIAGIAALVVLGMVCVSCRRLEGILKKLADRPQVAAVYPGVAVAATKEKPPSMIVREFVPFERIEPRWSLSTAGFRVYDPEIQTGYTIDGVPHYAGARVPEGVVLAVGQDTITVKRESGGELTIIRLVGAVAQSSGNGAK